MYLYSLTLQKATAITHAIYGNFSSPTAQEIVVSRGKILELLRPNDNGKVQTILSMEVFGMIRSLKPFRLTGDTRDYIIVGSDSGRIVILQYNPSTNTFDKIHQETFGKSGCRRIVPGQYLAVDPKGRACMIAAVEKQKLVYILNRDKEARLTISSPLEAHKSHTLLFATCGVDVGFENPIFACLEIDYSEIDADSSNTVLPTISKSLTFYELDLGLNHVVRKWSEPIDKTANLLFTVPGGEGGIDGPGGVLICCEDYLLWKNQGHDEIRIKLPERKNWECYTTAPELGQQFELKTEDDDDEEKEKEKDEKEVEMKRKRKNLIVSGSLHRQKGLFFFLLQNEYGDLFKVTLNWAGQSVLGIKAKYFDTVPVANSLCVLKTGLLFVASEFGNHYLYQFQSIGDDEKEEIQNDTDLTYDVRELKNLAAVDELESLSPIMDFKVGDLAKEEDKQIYVLCGRGPSSSLRVLRFGLSVTEHAVSDLPMAASAVWTVKGNRSDSTDKYIIVAFPNLTSVLSVGVDVEEATDSGLERKATTLLVGLLGEDMICQVHQKGVRIVRNGESKEWSAPSNKMIVKAAMNSRQLVVVIGGNEIVYFEIDETVKALNEIARKDMDKAISSIELSPLKSEVGEGRARFLILGGFENIIKILSLYPGDRFATLAIQGLPAAPVSLAMTEMHIGHVVRSQTNNSEGSSNSVYSTYEDVVGYSTLFMHVGLSNGVVMRATVDKITGEIADVRNRFVGTRPVTLFKIKIHGESAVVATSSKTWICYGFMGSIKLVPLNYMPFESVSGFESEQCEEGMIGLGADRTLRVISCDKIDESWSQLTYNLRYTPRKAVVHPSTNFLITIETEHNCLSSLLKGSYNSRLLKLNKSESESESESSSVSDVKMEVDNDENENDVDDEDDKKKSKLELIQDLNSAKDEQDRRENHFKLFGSPKPGEGIWASCLRIWDPLSASTLDLLELDNNEAAFSLCTCVFHDTAGEVYLVVGTAKDMVLHPRSCNQGFIHVYKLRDGGKRFELLHKTPVEDVPGALCPFQGRLLVSVGKILRIYDLGQKRLLRRCEARNFPFFIRSIATQGDRIVVGDIAESFHFVKYRKQDSSLVIFADDSIPRWLTASAMLDYDTMAGADKFGNLFIVRLPEEATDTDDGSSSIGSVGGGRSTVNGAPYKVDTLIQYHTGETVMALTKGSIVMGGEDVVIYATVMGGLGVLVPFAVREDVDFFGHLEIHMRNALPPLAGREHLAFRSYYGPVKDVVDGDLCELFAVLPPEKQREVARELDRAPSEILRKLEVMRNMLV